VILVVFAFVSSPNFADIYPRAELFPEREINSAAHRCRVREGEDGWLSETRCACVACAWRVRFETREGCVFYAWTDVWVGEGAGRGSRRRRHRLPQKWYRNFRENLLVNFAEQVVELESHAHNFHEKQKAVTQEKSGPEPENRRNFLGYLRIRRIFLAEKGRESPWSRS